MHLNLGTCRASVPRACMSAPGYSRLFSGAPSDFRCRPESRHSCPNVRFPPNFVSFRSENGLGAEGPFSSVFDPKPKFDTPSQNNRIRTPRRSLEGPNLLERISRCSPPNVGPSGAYGGVHGFGERGIGASNVDRTVGNMCTEIPNAVSFFSKTTKSCCISLKNP